MQRTTAAAPGAHRAPSRATFAVLALVVAAVNLPQSVMVPVLPQIQHDYGTDQVTATWMITGFLLSSGIATPLLGRLGDVYGQRTVLLGALGTLALGSIGTVLAPTLGWAIATRIVQGVSGGCVPVAFSALRHAIPASRLRYGVAVLATVGSIAFSAGTVAAGPMLEAFGVGSLFVTTCVVALVAAVGVAAVVPDNRPEHVPARFGVAGVLLFSSGLICLLLAISQSTSRGWTSATVLGLGTAAAVLCVAWVGAERRARTPFIDLAMMRHRGMWTSNLVAFIAGIGLFGCAAGLPPLLQSPAEAGFGVGADLTTVGLLMMPIALSAFLTSLCTGAIYRFVTARTVIVTGAWVSAASYLGIALAHDDAWTIVVWCAIQGVGNGLILSTVASVVVASVPTAQTGVANGMNTNLRTVGGALGAAVTAAILASHTIGTSTHGVVPSERGFQLAFGVMAASMAIAGLAALMVPTPRWAARRAAVALATGEPQAT
jgi:MFS family permease